ncbi:MAG: hypothetical protein A4S09_14300 [Proteobacteria bacterium SG_bin7]|nr:MAG: hypothetical protein A4S09_14300 [Proteobacteria bacterium SG_bin7]
MFGVNWSLKNKILFLNLGIILALGAATVVLSDRLLDKAEEKVVDSVVNYSSHLATAIEAQFFERYGDVQAFALNPDVRANDKQTIVTALNNYAALYGIYDLILVVDKNGKLVATNDKAPDGKPINVDGLYRENFSNVSWFRAALAGNFTEEKSKNLVGTYVEDPHQDPHVTSAYGSPQYVSSFSTQLKNDKGDVIGVISNRAGFRWVEYEFKHLYGALNAAGLKAAELTMLSKDGTVLVDYDPALRGSTEVQHNFDVLGKLNLVEKRVKAAEQVVTGRGGREVSMHARKHIEQIAGFAPVKGPKITEQLGWGVLVRVSREEITAEMEKFRNWFFVVFSVIAGCIVIVSLAFSTRLGHALQKIVNGLNEGANATADTARAATQMSTNLSEGTTEQAAAIQETAASIDEVTAMVKKNSENASLSQKISRDSKAAADQGKNAVDDMTDAITQISQANTDIMRQVEDGNREIGEIVKVIAEIGNKTKIINDIVFQTKLLSFNASVEAARAGEHGKGFAVVAEEVGNLAQMSGNAAKEISSMLESGIQRVEGIVNQTREKVERLIVEGKGKVDLGTRTAEKCGEALDNILKFVADVDNMVGEIANASNEQAHGISEINKAINQLDSVTQQNSKSAQQAASSAEDLSNQAMTLKNMVDELTLLFRGSAGGNSSLNSTPNQNRNQKKVIPFAEIKKKLVSATTVAKKAAGATEVPSGDDPRFEEV